MEETKRKSHRRSGPSSSSWGEGVQLTQKIFEDIIPYSCAEERTIEKVTKIFHEKNQRFLNDRKFTKKADFFLDSLPRSDSPRPQRNDSKRPPLASTAGLVAGRGLLKPIGDDNWSESSQASKQAGHHQRRRSATSASGESTCQSSTGYSGDDNWSFGSVEYSSDIQKLQDALYEDRKLANRRLEQQRIQSSRKEKKFIKMFFRELEKEKEDLIAEWREELNRENDNRWANSWENLQKKMKERLIEPMWAWLTFSEVLISNLPLTIGAVGLSWVTQGVVWFKFMEENIDECTTVRFNSPQCTFPEFPGCFQCDTSNKIYHFTVLFHYFCHAVALTCCLLFLAKCLIAWETVADELSNPTTATPVGVVCITLICVAAGRGLVGEAVVIGTSIFHVLLSFWFLYIAIFVFRLWPDPGWFPNTVGIAYAAIKTWLYFPVPGLAIMALCTVYLFATFPVALYRAYYNHKISAPVCFISLSAPSITMYAMTIMAQSRPSEEMLIERNPEFAREWRDVHRELYIPLQHIMMILSLIGFGSSLHCLWTRWPKFRTRPFSPAHVAFIFPILSHTNAVQAYRAGFNTFSNDPAGSPFHIALFTYWFTCLVCGTGLNLLFTYKYIMKLPEWTKMDEAFVESEIPPSPKNTFVHEMMEEEEGAHEVLRQSFTSPAVLQANEAGTLVRVRRGTEDFENFGPYVRTRNVASLGFDPKLSAAELRQERAELLDWVAKNAPRTRNRTLSIPQTFKLWDHSSRDGVYGTFQRDDNPEHQGDMEYHRRARTWGSWKL